MVYMITIFKYLFKIIENYNDKMNILRHGETLQIRTISFHKSNNKAQQI